MQIYTPLNKNRFIRCKTKINSHAYKSMCMLDCYLLEHTLVCYSIALSLSAHGSCLSNQPYLPVTPQGQRGQEKENMADNSTMANAHALAVIVGVLSTGTSTPQQSSSKPKEPRSIKTWDRADSGTLCRLFQVQWRLHAG